MADIQNIERDPEFEAYLPLFKHKQVEPSLPEFSEEWMNRSPRIQWEDATMVTSTGGKRVLPYLAAAAVLVVGISAAVFLFLNRGPKVPAVSHTGDLKAVAVFVKGDVSNAVSSSPKSALHTGDVLKAGTTITTGGDGLVDLAFEGGSIVRLRENTTVVLATPQDPEKGVIIEQGTGQTVHLVKKLENNFEHSSLSPTAVASVRGTVYEFDVDASGSTVTVAEGKVEASGIKGRTETHVIEADHQIKLTENRDEPVGKDAKALLKEAEEMRDHAAAFNEASAMTRDLKEVKSEEDLRKAYQQEIELITLGDGRVLRGIVVAQSGGKLLVQTVSGSHFVSEEDVRNIRYATEVAP